MESLRLLTSAGEFGLVGSLSVTRSRPTLLMIGGVFPNPASHHEIVGWFPWANVVVASLPGMLGANWFGAGPAEQQAGLGELIGRIFGDLPIVLCAGSAGSLMAIPLQAPSVRRKVILDPFLRTGPLWPLRDWVLGHLRDTPEPTASRYIWTMFGFREEGSEDRNFEHILDSLDTPTDVIAGGVPLLPPRRLDSWPSLTSEADRARLRAHPMVNWIDGPADVGHDLWLHAEAAALIRETLERRLRELKAEL